MNNIKIIQTYLPTTFPEESFFYLIQEFPKHLKEYILKFQHQNDRNLSAVGYSLLAYMLKSYGTSLNSLERDENNRPFIKEFAGDFNISHSKQSVICTVSAIGRIGIDIEHIRNMEITPFKEQFSPRQWQGILNDRNSLESFYNAWCKKEAIVKLDGRGLGVALSEIPLVRSFKFDNQQIYCQNIDVGSAYSAAVACNFDVVIPAVLHLPFELLFNEK